MLETLYPANRFSAQCLIRYIAGNLAHRARTRYVGFWLLVSFIVPNSGLLYAESAVRPDSIDQSLGNGLREAVVPKAVPE